MTARILGPFVGYVTDSTARIWLCLPDPEEVPPVSERIIYVTLHERPTSPAITKSSIALSAATLYAGCAEFTTLTPDTIYFYRIWLDPNSELALDLDGLTTDELYFRTLPSDGYSDRLDFLLMSCHNPETNLNDGFDGFAVWARMPDIIRENPHVRFAVLAGDQVYADEVESRVLGQTDPQIRLKEYLEIYRKFWSALAYRKVLCCLPSVLMWDDHDITDGWGSRLDSFEKENAAKFKPEWVNLFSSAKAAFQHMQANRNPEPLSPGFAGGFDFCFRVGRAGFVVMDLRTNRNLGLPQITTPQQREAVKQWVDANKGELQTLFFVSTVVFSHGAPQVESWILRRWYEVMTFISGLKRYSWLRWLPRLFLKNVGDLRDDIDDSWGAEVNASETDVMLDFLFGLQNPKDGKPLSVVILSGDIHTPGYATLYSADPTHSMALIPHITATPVAYAPFSWIGEAVSRHVSKVVKLGKKDVYTAQVSHHYCYRNVVVVSLRDFDGKENQLKVKYYLEGFPEPQILVFDLKRGSHREDISWPATPKPLNVTVSPPPDPR